MEENRPSIDDILIQWFHSHGKRFRKGNRQDAIRELVEIMASYGYTRGAIEGAKPKIMKCLVGPSSPRGTKGLKEWNGIADSEFRFVMASLFALVTKSNAGEVSIPFTPGTDVPVEASPDAPQTEDVPALNEYVAPKENVIYDSEPVIRPELDRSMFKNVETTPVMSDEEFWASLESETDEQ